MILISPYSRKLKNNDENPKNYPFWKPLIKKLTGKIIQIGVAGEEPLVKDFRPNLPLREIRELLSESDFWISCDNFLPHLAHHVRKRGLVIWGQSDPKIFGYSENVNVLKSRTCLRPNQFDIWELSKFNSDAFSDPEDIVRLIGKHFSIVGLQ